MATVKAFNSLKVAGKQHLSVGSHMLAPYKEGPSQTFKAGAPISLATSGLAAEAANPNNLDLLVGIAARDAENNALNNPLQVFPAIPGIIFEGVLGNTADDLYAIAQADVGKYAALTRSADLAWHLNATTAATARPNNSRVKIVALKDPVGTVNGKVYFTFTTDGKDNAGAVVPGTIYS